MPADETITPKPPLGVQEKRLESRFPKESHVEVSWVDVQDRVKTAQATVMNHSDHGVGLKVPTRVSVGSIIWMRDVDGELAKAVVRYSRNHELGDWQTGVRVIEREMRGAGRDPVRGAAELRWTAPSGKTCAVVATVIDLSDSGAGVVAPCELARGQFVELLGEQFECFCSVRNCHDVGEGNVRLGLLFARDPHDRTHGVSAEWLD